VADAEGGRARKRKRKKEKESKFIRKAI